LITRAKKIQEAKIAELAMLGVLNANMSTFFLKNHHRDTYRDRTDLDFNTSVNLIFDKDDKDA